MHARAEQDFLEVAVSLLLGQVNEFVEDLETLGFLGAVLQGLAKTVKVAAAPVEIAVIGLLEQIRDFLKDVYEVLGPAGAHEAAYDVPRPDRGVIDHKLVLGLVLSARANLDSPLHEGEGVLDLCQVGLALKVGLSNFALLFIIQIKVSRYRNYTMDLE